MTGEHVVHAPVLPHAKALPVLDGWSGRGLYQSHSQTHAVEWARQKPGFSDIFSSLASILEYHLPGTASGIAKAPLETVSARIPTTTFIFFMIPSNCEGDRYSGEWFMLAGGWVRYGFVK